MPQLRRTSNIQSVSRAIAILCCFNEADELGLAEITKLVGLHKSTVAGIVNTLKAERFLEQNRNTGKFRLGIDLFCLAANARLELSDICAPYLDQLLYSTGETVNLAVRDGNHVVFIIKKESPHSMRICTNVGKRLPLYSTAIGKSILAFLDEDELNKIFEETIMEKFTDKTITVQEELITQLRTIRRDRVAYDFEELEYGLVCVAAPILNQRNLPVGAISVSGPSMRMGEKARNQIAENVKQIAEKIHSEVSRISMV